MRKRKIVPPKYYAYYDKNTGQLLSITNEKSLHLKHFVEITEEMHVSLVTGKEKFSDYVLGRVRTDDGKKVLKLIPKTQEAYSFKNTLFELISEKPNRDTELTVYWNLKERKWEFALSAAGKKRTASNISDTKLIFFVILEHDYDFLIRSILIDANDLLKLKRVAVPFSTEMELHIDKISVATKLTHE